MKNKLLIFILLLTVIFPNRILANSFEAENNQTEYMHYEKAVVTKTSDFSKEDSFGNMEQKVEVKFLTGENKGKTIEVVNSVSTQLNSNLNLKIGDKVLILENKDFDGKTVYSVSDYLRTDYLYILAGAFILLLLIIGRKKGILSVVSLLLTLGVIIFGAIPMIIKGYSPVVMAVLSSIVISIFTILIVTGFSKKSLCAILGTCLGTILAALIAYFVGSKLHLTGLSMDETQMLLYLPNNLTLDPKELLLAGIIWGSLGAVMDVGMSISSSIFEISSANSELGFKDLLKSGMNVGRDIMGTMSNTLILAYLGSALPLILLMMVFNQSNYKIINLDVIATEIVRSLSGSIGLLFTIPITAILASYLMQQKNRH
ncbi:YibE/F family protein [Peptoniphilus asaccharolyticus]